jgi:hypothetical protein
MKWDLPGSETGFNRFEDNFSDGAHGLGFFTLHPSLSRSIQLYPARTDHLSHDINVTSGRQA